MLVLTRKQGEEIVIGDNIRLKVVAIRGTQVRLGVAAPRHISVQREELCWRAADVGTAAVRPANLELET
jgi:carbon storage regulator